MGRLANFHACKSIPSFYDFLFSQLFCVPMPTPSSPILFKDAQVIWASFTDGSNISGLNVQDIATAFASSSYCRCVFAATFVQTWQNDSPEVFENWQYFAIV